MTEFIEFIVLSYSNVPSNGHIDLSCVDIHSVGTWGTPTAGQGQPKPFSLLWMPNTYAIPNPCVQWYRASQMLHIQIEH